VCVCVGNVVICVFVGRFELVVGESLAGVGCGGMGMD
jgi:hypothetical protein